MFVNLADYHVFFLFFRGKRSKTERSELIVASNYLRYAETHPEYYPLTQIDEATIFC